MPIFLFHSHTRTWCRGGSCRSPAFGVTFCTGGPGARAVIVRDGQRCPVIAAELPKALRGSESRAPRPGGFFFSATEARRQNARPRTDRYYACYICMHFLYLEETEIHISKTEWTRASVRAGESNGRRLASPLYNTERSSGRPSRWLQVAACRSAEGRSARVTAYSPIASGLHRLGPGPGVTSVRGRAEQSQGRFHLHGVQPGP